jgi:hypothetical protein
MTRKALGLRHREKQNSTTTGRGSTSADTLLFSICTEHFDFPG